MSVHKNVNVCVTTSPRLLMKIDARRTGQQPAGLSSQTAPTFYADAVRRNDHQECPQKLQPQA